jgi:hypothetical protein
MGLSDAQREADLALLRRAARKPLGSGFEEGPQVVARMPLDFHERLTTLEATRKSHSSKRQALRCHGDLPISSAGLTWQ